MSLEGDRAPSNGPGRRLVSGFAGFILSTAGRAPASSCVLVCSPFLGRLDQDASGRACHQDGCGAAAMTT